jgi:hypothetical protein
MLRRLLVRGAALAAGVVAALASPALAGAATVALWHMDETAGTTMADSVGGHDGRLRHVALGQPGFSGTGYGFAGLGSVATVPSRADLNPGAAPFTVTLHFRTSVVSPDDSEDLMRKGLSTDSARLWKIELRPNASHTAARVRCYFHGSRAAASIYASPMNVADGAWHTLQCFKQSGLVGMIFDGKVRTKPARVGSISNGAVLTIGAKSATDDAFPGLIDEVAFDV